MGLANQVDGACVAAVQHLGERTREGTIGLRYVHAIAVEVITTGIRVDGQSMLADYGTQVLMAEHVPMMEHCGPPSICHRPSLRERGNCAELRAFAGEALEPTWSKTRCSASSFLQFRIMCKVAVYTMHIK